MEPTPRKRRLQACERCAKRKQKCDRLLPACTGCVEANAECESRQLSISRTAEEAGGISHAAMPNYVETLKRKAQELHSNVRSQRARLQSAPSAPLLPEPTPHVHATSPGICEQSPATVVSTGTQQSVQATMGDIDFLSRSAMAEPREETHGFPPQLGMESMVRAVLQIPGENAPHSSGLVASRPRLPVVGMASKISREVAEPYLQLLFQHRESIYLTLSEATLKQDANIAFGRGMEDLAVHEISSVYHVRCFRARMAVALGMLISGDLDCNVFADDLHKQAMEHLPAVLQSNDVLNVVSCLLFLIYFSILSAGGGGPTWHLVGLAMKKCIAFKLHKKPQPELRLPHPQVERRKQVFWSLYVVDRAISCVLDRPFSIEDVDITVEIPRETETPGDDIRHQVLIHSRLMSSMRTLASQPASFHHYNLRHWRESALRFNSLTTPDTGCSTLVAQLTCRGYAQIWKVASTAQPSYNIIKSDRWFEGDVADGCREFIDQEFNRSQQGCFTGSFLHGYDLFAAAVLLVCQPTAPHAQDLSFISKCTVLLTLIGKRFACFRTMCRLLWDLSRVVSHGGANGPTIKHLPEEIPDGLYNLTKQFLQRKRQIA
ncbi:hypothetical protein BDV59DRAFT_149896 [Aspergillus ambiguus]|uniref:uncharacterized protein n=1 Tax=Aspergillus ambiguus TaxID=176160 RepID=UPI003CCD7B42